MVRAGVVYVHIGTHKTGTTSIQAFLGANDVGFADAGVLLPRTGRVDPAFASHPNIAWELTNDPRFDVRYGTFGELLHEIAASGLPGVCISAEDLDMLHLHPNSLARLFAGLRATGYEPKVVAYLRPQVDYCESLYAELVRGGWRIALEEILDDVFAETPNLTVRFDYARMIDAFAREVGEESVILRRFEATAESDRLLRDFTRILGADPLVRRFGEFQRPARLNERQAFRDVYEAAARVLGHTATFDDAETSTGAFEPLTIVDIGVICSRFAHVNRRVWQTYGVWIPPISSHRLLTALRDVLALDGSALRRKRSFEPVRAGFAPAHLHVQQCDAERVRG